MAKSARKASTKTVAKSSSATKSSAYHRIRDRIEGMYALHLLLLVAMSSLAAAMFVIMMNQRLDIQKLEFERDFMEQRYEALRDANAQRRAQAEAVDLAE